MSKTVTIKPYKYYDQWVFDDPSTGLDKEAFVDGADTLIDKVVAKLGISHAALGFLMTFSAEPFDGANVVLNKKGPCLTLSGGTYYEYEGHSLWLCPSLGLYFKTPPLKLYVKVEEDPEMIPLEGAGESREQYWARFVDKLKDQA
jgi:hypothetical protein